MIDQRTADRLGWKGDLTLLENLLTEAATFGYRVAQDTYLKNPVPWPKGLYAATKDKLTAEIEIMAKPYGAMISADVLKGMQLQASHAFGQRCIELLGNVHPEGSA